MPKKRMTQREKTERARIKKKHCGKDMRLSTEAVGVAKALKIALRLREFEQELKEKGVSEYKLIDQYEYIKDILEA